MPRRELRYGKQVSDWLEDLGKSLRTSGNMLLIGSAGLLWHAHARGAWGQDRLPRTPGTSRNREAATGRAGFDLPDLLDDEADRERRPHDAVGAGPLPARRSGVEVHPNVEGPARVRRRQPSELEDGAGRASDERPRSAQPPVGPHLRLHGADEHRRRVPHPPRSRPHAWRLRGA